jgi:hypothetical protein
VNPNRSPRVASLVELGAVDARQLQMGSEAHCCPRRVELREHAGIRARLATKRT